MYKNILVISSLCLSMVASPLLAFAQAPQASAVAGSGMVATPVATVMPATAKACYGFSRSLFMGARGSDVTALQQFLIDHGFTIPAGATGYFGSQTKAAVASWQAENNVAQRMNAGSGIFGPLSRGAFARWCASNSGSTGTSTSTVSVFSFAADPASGTAPLSVTFTATAPVSSGSSTLSVDFGDGTEAPALVKGSCIVITAVVGGQGGIRCTSTIAHTYTTAGTYTATLMNNTCPAGAQCFVGPMKVSTTVVKVSSSTATSTAQILKVNAPGKVTLAVGDIAEVRNEHMYFTLTALTTEKATIQTTGVGCWNWYPSDVPPEVRCMMMAMPVAPQTLGVGESYDNGSYRITLAEIKNKTATFSVASSTTHQ